MKKRLILTGAALLFTALMVASPFTTLAATQTNIPYATYTFGYNGEVLESPHAYVPQMSTTAVELSLDSLRGANDIKASKDGLLYISDTDHSRIVVMDIAGNLKSVFDRFMNGEKEDTFSGPMGIFLTRDDHLYVSDTGNRRILEFDENRQLVREIAKPNSVLLPENYNFAPSHLAVDGAGRMYVISEQTTYGIMVFNKDGTFVSFLGSQKTTMDAIDLLWRKFMTKAQRENLQKNVPTNYSNLTIDEKGFVYATSVVADDYLALSAIRQRSISPDYAMIKKFNSSGEEVLKRYGFYPPAGDVSAKDFSYNSLGSEGNQTGASHMTAVALGENGSYTLFDKKRNKIFAYDSEGNLLYAFGGTGAQQGLFSQITSGCYYGEDLYVLDGTQGKVTKFVRTDYGRLLHETIDYNLNREYEKAVENWHKVLQQNNGLCVANIGIGKALMRLGEYEESMVYFKKAHDVTNYSKAYEYQRNDFLKSGYIFLVPVVIVLFVMGLTWVSRKLRRIAFLPADGKRHLSRELAYAQYVLFHPFDGAWCIKNEKRGSFSAALILTLAAAVSMIVKDLITGYIVNPTEGKGYNVFTNFGAIALVIILFCIANWCVTTLMDGKGNLKDIFTIVGYSVAPLILFSIPAGLLSNYFAQSEISFFTAFLMVGYVWCGFLLFFGILTVHEYSLGKGVLAFLLTILGMIIIMFIGILCINLFNKIFVFIGNLYTEISLRY